MLSSNLYKGLIREFNKVERGENPQVTGNIEAVVVLSGESQDPAIKTTWHDTEERLAEGIAIYKQVVNLGGSPTLILNGTNPQNAFMEKEAKLREIGKIMTIKNPPYPMASTKTQFQGLSGLGFHKMIIIIHADYGPRTMRYIDKFLKDIDVKLFLIGRDKMKKSEMQVEIEKILEYFPEEFENL